MISEKIDSSKVLWRSVLGIVMVCAGCVCFVLSCVAAMILSGRE